MNDISIIKKALSEKIQPCRDPNLASTWAQFGFYVGFQLFKMIRPWRLKIASLVREDKSDGSPATVLEEKAEAFAKEALMAFYSDAGFQGEETGAHDVHHLYQLIIDPIDGTRSFLSGFDTYSVTLGIMRERKPVFSLIINPASGDFAYRIAGEQSRIFQYPFFSKEISLVNLPYLRDQNAADAPILVNIHPSKTATPYQQQLQRLWENREVALVKSVSGSPSLQILEVARGGSFYFNTWFEGETMPYDLIVPLDILRGAGGQILDKKGDPINPWNHRGPFLAGVRQEKLDWLFSILKVH